MIRKKHAGNLRPLIVAVLSYVFLLFSAAILVEAQTVPVNGRIPVSVSGGNPLETFTILLEPETQELQSPEQLFLRLKAEEAGEFSIAYTVPGTYRYTVRQNKGSDSKTAYDSSVYEVEMVVTEDEKGVLHAEPVVYGSDREEKKAEIRFTNTAESTPSKNQRTSSEVQTGDTTELPLYLGLLAASTAVLVKLGKSRWNKKGDE